MNRNALTIIVLQAVIIVILFWVLVFYGKDEYEAYTRNQEDEIESVSKVSNDQGTTVITLSEETQRQSNIATEVLGSSTYQGALSGFGSVVSIDPLLELRTRYLAAKADANVVRASIASSQQEYQRLAQLYQDNRNVAERAVIAAQAAWKADEAKLAAAETAAASIRDTMRQQWGDTLAGWATQQPAPAALESLLQYREVLLQVTLPPDAPTPEKDARITVEVPSGDRPIDAVFVATSPRTDSAIQGKTFFYRAPAGTLRVGMRVTVRMAERAKSSTTGVIVPATAVVWYGGKAWVYRKEGADKFFRIPINTDQEVSGGWFVSSGLRSGDIVVISGAQLLLSEEFRYQIKNENED